MKNPDSFELLSALAHDLRNPLTAIKGHAQILLRRSRRQGVDPAQFADGLNQIEQAASRMQDMLAEFLDLARVHEGRRLELAAGPTDVAQLLVETVQLVEADWPGNRITVRSQSSRSAGNFDYVRLQRAFRILLERVVSSIASEDEITLTVRFTEAGQRIVVESQVGNGHVDPNSTNDSDELFDAFSPPSTTDAKSLAREDLARAIIEAAGGSLDLDGPDHFRVRLPAAVAEAS